MAEPIVIDRPITLDANGATINATVTVNDIDATIKNANLVCFGSSASDKAPALNVTGTHNFTLSNSTLSGSARTGMNVKCGGNVVIEGCTFDGGDQAIYNAVEFSISNDVDVTNAVIRNNTFKGNLKNNAISMYNFADGAKVEISGNTFSGIDVNNNPIRLSNPKNASVEFNISNNTYTFSSSTASQYTGFMLLQDYAKEGAVQDFGKFKINFANLKRGSKKLVEKGTGLNRVYYVYDDQNGILADGVNDPVVTFA